MKIKASGSITLKNLTEPFTVLLSNEMQQFSTDSNRKVTSAQSYYTDIIVYQGSTKRTDFIIGNVPSANGITVTKSSARITFAVGSGATISADTGTFTIPITLEGKTVNKIFSWSCGKQGVTGTSAKSVDIIANSQIFKSTDGGQTFSPKTIKLTPTFQGGISFSKWQYSIDGGVTWKDVVSGNNGLYISSSILTINKTSNLYTDTTTSITFKCISNNTSYYDTLTVIKLYDVTDIKIGGRNLILNGKGNKKAGFFKNFPTVTDEYGEITLKSKKTYVSINIADGFLLGCREYTVGEQVTWSYDIMYTAWNFPTGTTRNEFWIGQRYTNPPSGQTGTGNWRIVTKHDLPVIGENGCELNKWYHVKVTMTIPEQASSNIGTASSIQFYNSNPDVEASFTARFKNVKLERGNIATDWTPAPEDVDSQIQSLVKTTTETSSVVNKLNQSITNKVWQSDITNSVNNYDNSTGKAIRDRLTKTETSLSGITSTVSDMKTTLDKKADGTTVQSLTTRVSKAEQDMSGFKQTVESTYSTKSETESVNNYAKTSFEQLSDKFSWLVDGTSSSTSLTLTDSLVSAITNQFVIKSPDGTSTIIEGGKIKTGAITTDMLSSSAIKSKNYMAGTYVEGAGYSVLGTFLDLDNGMIHTPSFYTDSSGNSFMSGTVHANAGWFGTDEHNWFLGTTTISNIMNDSGALTDGDYSYLKATDNTAIIAGDWYFMSQNSTMGLHSGLSTLNNGNFVKNPVDGKYYDFGIVEPDMSKDAKDYNKKFLYIRRADSTQTHPQDWEYLFRVDYDGKIWYKGNLIAGEGGMFLSTTGGTITGNLTVNGKLTATASSADKLLRALTINGKSFTGSSAVDVGTIGIAYGGTGATSASGARTNLGVIGTKNANGFYGLTRPDGNDSDWIRSTVNGLIPYQSGNAGDGHSQLGADTWYFSKAYIDNIYGNLQGNAKTASKLSTPRKIGNASFDGSSDITLAQMGVNNPIEITKADYEDLKKNNKIDMSAYYNIIDDYDSIGIINDKYISSNQVFSSSKIDSVYSKKSISYNITLESQKWVKKNDKYQYVLSVNEITEANIIEINYSPNATADEINAYQKAYLKDGGQSKGQGILLADILPAINIPITVIIRND